MRRLLVAIGTAASLTALTPAIGAHAQGLDMAGMGGPTGGTSNGWCQGGGSDLNNAFHANGPDHVCVPGN